MAYASAIYTSSLFSWGRSPDVSVFFTTPGTPATNEVAAYCGVFSYISRLRNIGSYSFEFDKHFKILSCAIPSNHALVKRIDVPHASPIVKYLYLSCASSGETHTGARKSKDYSKSGLDILRFAQTPNAFV